MSDEVTPNSRPADTRPDETGPVDAMPAGEATDPAAKQEQGQGQGATPSGREGLTPGGQVHGTRVSAWWVGLIVAAVVLAVLLVFVAQNSRDVTVRFLGLRGQVSLAVESLFWAVGGALLVAIPGTARIWQLRRALKRNAETPATTGTTTW